MKSSSTEGGEQTPAYQRCAPRACAYTRDPTASLTASLTTTLIARLPRAHRCIAGVNASIQIKDVSSGCDPGDSSSNAPPRAITADSVSVLIRRSAAFHGEEERQQELSTPEVTTEIIDDGQGMLEVSYCIPHSGWWYAQVLNHTGEDLAATGDEIDGSPFHIFVWPGGTAVSESRVAKPGLESVRIGDQVSFLVQLLDKVRICRATLTQCRVVPRRSFCKGAPFPHHLSSEIVCDKEASRSMSWSKAPQSQGRCLIWPTGPTKLASLLARTTRRD